MSSFKLVLFSCSKVVSHAKNVNTHSILCTILTADKELNRFIYGAPFYFVICSSERLLK